jgi:hypothetical protein
LETNFSQKTTQTKLFKEKESLGLEFVYETNEAAFFGSEIEGEIYWLIEVFETGEIMVSDEQGSVLEKSERFLNLLRLKL